MNTLYIVRGLTGSGKSQFARKLVSREEFVFEANKYMQMCIRDRYTNDKKTYRRRTYYLSKFMFNI